MEKGSGLTRAVVGSAGTIMLTTFMFGWTNGNMNTPAPIMREALGIAHHDSEPGNDVAWGWIVSIYCAGGMLGCSRSARLADDFGRKRFILLAAAAFMVGACLQAAAMAGGSIGTACMLAGRLVVGAASGGTTVVVPTFMNEIAPMHWRGSLGVTFQVRGAAAR